MTTTFDVWASALPALLVLALFGWLISLATRSAQVPGALWAVMMFAACVSYALDSDPRATRLASVPPLVVFWAARHVVYLVSRHPRDPDRDLEPGAGFRNLFAVFVPQALLAWIVSLPLLGALTSLRPAGLLDDAGFVLLGIGVLFEVISRWLARFQREPATTFMGRALRLATRHPNYMGETLIWWGFWLLACAAGAWWALPGPLVITGLALLAARPRPENDSGKGRPRYADYVLKTNAFFPARRRN